jgi:hypothetical protein
MPGKTRLYVQVTQRLFRRHDALKPVMKFAMKTSTCMSPGGADHARFVNTVVEDRSHSPGLPLRCTALHI